MKTIIYVLIAGQILIIAYVVAVGAWHQAQWYVYIVAALTLAILIVNKIQGRKPF